MTPGNAQRLMDFYKSKQSKSIIDAAVGNGSKRIVEHWTKRRIQVAQISKHGK